MTGRLSAPLVLGLCLVLGPPASAVAGDVPPPDGQPLWTILKSVERLNVGVIANVEFEDGRWEVRACRSGACHKFYFDPKSGEEKRRRTTHSDDVMPPANALPLSAVVESVQDRGMGIVTEVEFKNGVWQIEVHDEDGNRTEVRIDPGTGERRR